MLTGSLRQAFRAAKPLLKQPGYRRLPWYLVLGPAGSGKTSLLARSGLPIVERRGSDLCTWSFSAQAVTLDLCGTLPDSLLPILLRRMKRARGGCPVDGVLLTIDTLLLLQGSEAEIGVHAERTHNQIILLQRALRRPFPLYLIVTQCDRLAGFSSFCNGLVDADRNRTWGTRFPLPEPGNKNTPPTDLAPAWHALTRQFEERMIDCLFRLSDPDDCALALTFPQQLGGLCDRLCAFLTQACGTLGDTATPLIRGVFVTSAIQDAQAWRRWLGPLAPDIGSQCIQTKESRTGFFIEALWSDVLLPDASPPGRCAQLTPRHARLRRWLPRMAAIGGVLLAGLLLTQRFLQTETRLQTARRQLLALERTYPAGDVATDVPRLLPVLDSLGELSHGSGLLGGFARYPETEFDTAVQDSYHALLEQALLPWMQGRLSSTMDNGQQSYAHRYEALRLYLMLGDRSHCQPEAIDRWMASDLAASAFDPRTQARLLKHVRALTAHGGFKANATLNIALISRTRTALRDMPLAPALFEDIMGRLQQAHPEVLSLTAMAGPEASQVLRRRSGTPFSEGISTNFTRAGFTRYAVMRDAVVADQNNARWVLGREQTPHTAAALGAAIDTLYFERTIQTWDTLLNDIGLQPLARLRERPGALMLLASDHSPLRRLLIAADQETRLAPPATSIALDAHFAPLHSLLSSQADGTPAPLEVIRMQFADLASAMQTESAWHRHGVPPARDRASLPLRRAAAEQPAPLGAWLRDLFSPAITSRENKETP
jgi:type VI secretion system protein ImpL